MAYRSVNVQYVRDACNRIGLGPGDRVIDVGCGPLGALHVLSDVVGPTGTVVGLDARKDVIRMAASILERRGLDRVVLVQGSLNEIVLSDLCSAGPFDAAYCRFFLVHQDDPGASLRRMASLVRPGGHIIAHELVDDPAYPYFEPSVPAAGRVFRLMYDALRRRGKAPDVARHFQRLVEEAGLVSVRQSGFLTSDVDEAPRFIRSDIIPLLHGLCEEHPLAQWGLAEQGEVDELIRELNEAASGSYEAFFSWILGECIARVPQP